MPTLAELQTTVDNAQKAYDAKVLEYGQNKKDAESTLSSIKSNWNIYQYVIFPAKLSTTDVTPFGICQSHSSCPPLFNKYQSLVDAYNTNKNYAEITLKANLDNAKKALNDFKSTDPHQQTLKVIKTIAVVVVVAVVVVGSIILMKKKGIF